MPRLALLLVAFAWPVHAASIDRARQVITMVYDFSLYDSELDRIMDEADTRGVYGGAGSTQAGRARDKSLTHATMLAQRAAVLDLATAKLAASASDEQLGELQHLAATGVEPSDRTQLDAAVGKVKASFVEAMWDQLARIARGNSMFPCTKDARRNC